MKIPPDICAALAAGFADEPMLDVGQPDMIGPTVGAYRNRVAAFVVSAIDQQSVDAGCAQFAEGDLLRAGGHVGYSSATAPFRQRPTDKVRFGRRYQRRMRDRFTVQ